MTIEFESVQRAERFGKLLHSIAVDVFHETAVAADRVMVMMGRLAEHVHYLVTALVRPERF